MSNLILLRTIHSTEQHPEDSAMASVESVRQRRLPSDGAQAFESEVSGNAHKNNLPLYLYLI